MGSSSAPNSKRSNGAEVSNDDLSEVMETTDEWITQRTGIRRRHVMEDEETLAWPGGAGRMGEHLTVGGTEHWVGWVGWVG